MLVIEVEFLTGVSIAARPNRREEAEWPPHPDRLFQAMVAAWGRNDLPLEDEKHALEWLEGLDDESLLVSAPLARPRQVATVFVPPNDARTTGRVGDKAPADLAAAIRVLPEVRKNRQPRSFPAVIPDAPPIVRYLWQNTPELDRHQAALGRLAREVTYLGHSHSLVRVIVLEAGAANEVNNEGWVEKHQPTLRLPYKGRLAHLSDRHHQSQMRSDGRVVRPNPSLVTRVFHSPSRTIPSGFFDPENVTVFADAGGFAPALVAFPLVAVRLRDALLRTAQQHALPIPTLLSGHDATGSPTREPHIAIVPLADVGWTHSQGRLLGLALVWPREPAVSERQAALRILASFIRTGRGDVGLLHFGRDGSWSLALDPAAERASLQFTRYARPARRWGTVLPAALDRHPKDRIGHELASIIFAACTNIGLPREAVDGLDVEIHKHAPVRGGPSAPETRKALPMDSTYRNKPIVHLVLTFREPVRGPMILGAGRFRGLGLCLPLDGG